MKFNMTQVTFIMKSLRQHGENTLEDLKVQLKEDLVPRRPTHAEKMESLDGYSKQALRELLALEAEAPALQWYNLTHEEATTHYYDKVNDLVKVLISALDAVNQQLLFNEREDLSYPSDLEESIDATLRGAYELFRAEV